MNVSGKWAYAPIPNAEQLETLPKKLSRAVRVRRLLFPTRLWGNLRRASALRNFKLDYGLGKGFRVTGFGAPLAVTSAS